MIKYASLFLIVIIFAFFSGCLDVSDEAGKKIAESNIDDKIKNATDDLSKLFNESVKMGIKKGDKVSVDYVGTLDDGTVFDSSEGREPLQFTVGARQVIAGFENAVIGKEKGDVINVKIPPEEAYGESNPELIREISKDQLPEGAEIAVGTSLIGTTPDGQMMQVYIVEVLNDTVKIDYNHPMAGKTLNFKITIVNVA